MANNAAITRNDLTNQFYRNNYPRLYRLLWAMIVVNLILVAGLIYLIVSEPPIKNYATVDGKNMQLYALDEPVVAQSALLQWASQAATAVYTYKYTDYAKVFAQASQYFTPEGWTQFQNGNKKNLDKVISQKLLVTAVATGAPVITDQGPLFGHYVWRISVPILVTYESSVEKRPQNLLVNMLVMRISPKINPKGIAIAQFNSVERAAQQR